MLQVCCECGDIYGEKPPLEDSRPTHGYCVPCGAKRLEEVLQTKKHHPRSFICPLCGTKTVIMFRRKDGSNCCLDCYQFMFPPEPKGSLDPEPAKKEKKYGF